MNEQNNITKIEPSSIGIGTPKPLFLWILTGSGVFFTLYALSSGYTYHIVIPMIKALFLVAATIIYGFFIGRGFSKSKNNPDLSSSFGVGLIFTSFYFYAASMLKILGWGTIAAFYVIPWILSALLLRDKEKQSELVCMVKNFTLRSPLEYAVFLLTFVYASLPPTFYDTLVYHLGIPNFYLQHGGFVANTQFLYANTSIYYEISLIPAVFAGDSVPGIFHFFIGIILVFSAADFGARHFGIKNRRLLTVLLVCMPMSIFLMTTLKNDLVSAFFIFLGIRYWIEKRWTISGLFWGFALGVKYFSLLPLVIFLVIFLIKEKAFPIKRLAGFGLVITGVMLPLSIKNFIFTGNPFFPFLGDFFKTAYWDASRFAIMEKDIGRMFHSLRGFTRLPYTASFESLGFGGTVGAQFLVFLPFLVAIRKQLKNKTAFFWFSLATFFAGAFFTASARFIYIAFICLTFYIAVISEALNRKVIHVLLSIVVGINLLTALAFQEEMFQSHGLFFGKMTVEEYKARMFPSYRAINAVNRDRGKPGTNREGVLLVGEARNFYLKKPYRVSSALDYSILKKYLDRSENAGDFKKVLQKDEIDYIIFNLAEFNRLQKEYHNLNLAEWRKFVNYLQDMQRDLAFQENGIFVFKLTFGKSGNSEEN